MILRALKSLMQGDEAVIVILSGTERLSEVIRAGAQVRAHGEEVGCAAYQGPGGELEVTLDAPIRGVAPGQSVVLYDGTRVIGSATISSTRAHPQSR